VLTDGGEEREQPESAGDSGSVDGLRLGPTAALGKAGQARARARARGGAQSRLYRGGAAAPGVPSTPAEGQWRHGQGGHGLKPCGSARPRWASAGLRLGWPRRAGSGLRARPRMDRRSFFPELIFSCKDKSRKI
jgi:hypothetical protein